MTNQFFDYAIIGNSSGAVGCIEGIRETTAEGTIAVISNETHHVYGRPIISYWLSREAGEKSLKYRPDDFYDKNVVTTFLGKTVTRLDASARTLALDDGQEICFGKLLISVGGAPIAPPIPGKDKTGVFTFNTLDDVFAIDKVLTPETRAVVIGGGLTGLKASEALLARGASVTLVELMDRLMGMATDQRASEIVKDIFEEHGCTLKLENTVEEILGDSDHVEGVRLKSGDTLPCDMVILAIGVRPRLELLDGTGIETNRGIVVDNTLATTVPGIYACGDVAEAYDFLQQTNRVLPLLPNAYVTGRIAGINMAGGNRIYDWGTSANSVDFFGYPLASAGKLIPDEGDECLVHDDGKRDYRKVILKDGVLTGLLFAGDYERIGILLGHMRKRTDMTGFKDALLTASPSTLKLPEPVVNATTGGAA